MQLTGKKGQRIKDVNTRKRLLINLNDGGSIHVTNMDREQLREIGALLVDIQNGKTCDIGETAFLLDKLFKVTHTPRLG